MTFFCQAVYVHTRLSVGRVTQKTWWAGVTLAEEEPVGADLINKQFSYQLAWPTSRPGSYETLKHIKLLLNPGVMHGSPISPLLLLVFKARFHNRETVCVHVKIYRNTFN